MISLSTANLEGKEDTDQSLGTDKRTRARTGLPFVDTETMLSHVIRACRSAGEVTP